MKVLVRPVVEPPGFVLAVDTHDSIDASLVRDDQRALLQELKEYNRNLARQAAAVWEEAVLPTQSSLLKQHLNKQP